MTEKTIKLSDWYLNKYNPNFKMRKYCTRDLSNAIRIGKFSPKLQSLVGCNFSTFKKHLISQFTPAMTWNSYARTWTLDHEIPYKFYDLTDKRELQQCMNYNNIQPLNPHENILKCANLSFILPIHCITTY